MSIDKYRSWNPHSPNTNVPTVQTPILISEILGSSYKFWAKKLVNVRQAGNASKIKSDEIKPRRMGRWGLFGYLNL